MKKFSCLLFLYSSILFASDCIPKKVSQDIDYKSKCIIDKYSNMASSLFGNIFGYQSFFKTCSQEEKAPDRQKMRYITEVGSSKCKHIKTINLSPTDYLNLNEPKCEDTLRVLFLKILEHSANSFSVKNFSEHCIPREVEVTTYCCQ